MTRFLENKGVPVDDFLGATSLSIESIKNSNSWLPAQEVENFLRSLSQKYNPLRITESPLLVDVGHSSHHLEVWGILDKILKLYTSPRDLYLFPQKLMHFFISPAPPIGNLVLGESSVQFELPIFEEEYPFVAQYIVAALESLPRYMGLKERAEVRWELTKIYISWSQQQRSIVKEQDLGRNVSPEILRSLTASLEKVYEDMEAVKEKLIEKDIDLEELRAKLKGQMTSSNFSVSTGQQNSFLDKMPVDIVSPMLSQLKAQVLKLSDYMTRSNQLVTMITGMASQAPRVKKVLKRMDWELISREGPQVLQGALATVECLLKGVGEEPVGYLESLSREESKKKIYLDALMEKVISSLTEGGKANGEDRLTKKLNFQKSIDIFPDQVESAFRKILGLIVENGCFNQEISIETKEKQFRAEIEFSSSGKTFSRAYWRRKKILSFVDSIIHMHQGNLTFFEKHTGGHSCIIDFPITQTVKTELGAGLGTSLEFYQ